MDPAFEKIARGDYEGALAACEQALARRPRSLESATLRLRLLSNQLERWPEALAAADDVLALVPPPSNAHLRTLATRASILMKMNRPDEAVACARSIVRHAPHDPQSYDRLARICAMAQRERDALAAYDHGIRLFPRSISLYERRARYLMACGRLEEAIRTFDAALAFAPDQSSLWYQRGRALARQGNVDQAVESLDRSLALRPELRSQAREDRHYARLRKDRRFRILVGLGRDYGLRAGDSA